MPEAKPSCGCVFCDLGEPRVTVNWFSGDYHIVGGDQIKCTRPKAIILPFVSDPSHPEGKEG